MSAHETVINQIPVNYGTNSQSEKETIENLLATYRTFGNLCINVKRYKKIESKLGKHTKRLLKKDNSKENDCYIIERIK